MIKLRLNWLERSGFPKHNEAFSENRINNGGGGDNGVEKWKNFLVPYSKAIIGTVNKLENNHNSI